MTGPGSSEADPDLWLHVSGEFAHKPKACPKTSSQVLAQIVEGLLGQTHI